MLFVSALTLMPKILLKSIRSDAPAFSKGLLVDGCTIFAFHIVLVRRGRNCHEEGDGLDSYPGVLLTAFAYPSHHYHGHIP